MTKVDYTNLRARPEDEDFFHKYTEEGQGKIGSKLLDGYFRAVHELIEESLTVDGQALEIGCGAGFSTKRLRDMLPTHVEFEASEYVEHLLPHAKKLNPLVHIYHDSVYDLSKKDHSVDMVFLLEVLEHLDHPKAALKEIKRIVKPGGYIILGVPREPLWRILNMARLKYLKDFGNTTGHLNHWSKTSISDLISREFGQVVAVRSPLPWTIVLAQKKI